MVKTRKSKISEHLFYKLYVVEKLTKKEIIEFFSITPKTYYIYVKKMEAFKMKDVSFDSIEKELTNLYNSTTDVKLKLRILDTSVRLLSEINKSKEGEVNPLLVDDDSNFTYETSVSQ